MHKVIERQIQRFLGEKGIEDMSEECKSLFQAISDTYNHFDNDRSLLLRSLDLSSEEFAEINKKLKSENEIIEEKVKIRTQELEYEKTKLNEIAQHMTTGAILLDKNGQVTFVNVAANKFLNITDINKSIDILAECFASVPIKENIDKSIKGESINIPEAEAMGKIFSISFASLKNETGTMGALIWLNDITVQKLLERSKSQFVEIAAHEMRTPLTIIRGDAELMLEDLEDKDVYDNDELKTNAESILKSVVRLLNIANDFLDVQNLEENKVFLDKTPVDIVKILEDIIPDLSNLAKEKNLYLVFNKPSFSIPLFNMDQSRLQQVYINLISNAIHYTIKGGVTISFENNGDAGIKIIFEDTGIGIHSEEQTRLFRKFETGKQFMHNKYYGSGLGLYICKLLCNLMGINIKLEKSEVGKGSVFSLTFPLPPKV